MQEEERYEFCPECGALMKDGVCVSCGHGRQTDQTAEGMPAENIPVENMPAGNIPAESISAGNMPVGNESAWNEAAESSPAEGMSGMENGAGAAEWGFDIQRPQGQVEPQPDLQPGAQEGSYGLRQGEDAAQPSQEPLQGGYTAQPPQGGNATQPSQEPLQGGYTAQPPQGGYATQPGGTYYGNMNPGAGQPGDYGSQPYPNGWNGYNGQGSYGGQNGYSNQGGYGGQNGYSNQGGYGGQNGYSNQGGYGGQNGYNNQGGYGGQNGYNNQNGYGGQNGYNSQGGYNGQPGQYGPQGYGSYGSSYGYAGGPQNPDKRNNNRAVAAIVITVIAVLLCVSMVLLFFIVKNSVKAMEGLAQNKGNFGSYSEETPVPYEEPVMPDEGVEEQVPDITENYVPSAEDDYYVTLADSIRDDLSYQIEWEEYSNQDDETGATAEGRYPQLVGGNIPHLDELNAAIAEEATYYSNIYGYYKEIQGSESLSYITSSYAYVTYMDEEKISIVLEESFLTNDESNLSLYSINIDLVSGEMMDNGTMIEYSENLAAAFRDQNDYQNGYVDAVDALSDEELMDFLSDPTTNIIFYTPVGLEIGYNYTTSDSSGWVTATIKDYEKYLKKI